MFPIPSALKWLEESETGREWLRELPSRVTACAGRWKLNLESPYQESFVSIVFPVTCSDGSPAVLKIQWPHSESDHEADALRRWNGQGVVRLFDYDPEHHALLLERCEPGDHLSRIGGEEALDVFAALLRPTWIKAGEPFRSLVDEANDWIEQLPLSWERTGRPFEKALLEAAQAALDKVSRTQSEQVLVNQDLHADNVLRAQREPWLAIDPKPVVGERELSLAPIIRGHAFEHSREAAIYRLDKLTSELQLDRERARLWALGQTLAWGFEGDRVYDRHVETARWLWQG